MDETTPHGSYTISAINTKEIKIMDEAKGPANLARVMCWKNHVEATGCLQTLSKLQSTTRPAMKRFCLCSLWSHLNVLTFFPPLTEGCPEGLDAFRFFFKYTSTPIHQYANTPIHQYTPGNPTGSKRLLRQHKNHSNVVVVVVVVSHIQRNGCQPKKSTLHGGQSRSWSAEQGKENKRRSLAAYPPPPPSTLLVRRKIKNKNHATHLHYSPRIASPVPR